VLPGEAGPRYREAERLYTNHRTPPGPPTNTGSRSLEPLSAGFRGLSIVRNFLTKTNPWLRAGRPNIQHRLKFRLTVQRGKADGHEFGSRFASREQRRAAFGTKAASCEATAGSTDRVCLRRPSDLCVRYQDDEAGSERRATGALAVSAMTVEHRDRCASTHKADRSACAPAGERSSHIVISLSSQMRHRL
jgi:hypothetical protein